eukprot:scaffold11041_cov69-Phaeocystis_antarctica.AAC.7
MPDGGDWGPLTACPFQGEGRPAGYPAEWTTSERYWEVLRLPLTGDRCGERDGCACARRPGLAEVSTRLAPPGAAIFQENVNNYTPGRAGAATPAPGPGATTASSQLAARWGCSLLQCGGTGERLHR